jgi:putative inorganic carbon (hco3(-)) transporter
MRLILVFLCFLAGTALSVGSVTFASCMFLWNNIFQPLTFAKSFGMYPTAIYVFGILVLSYAVNLFRRRFKPNFGPFAVAMGIMVFWILLCTIMSPYQATAWTEFIRYMKYLGPLFLIYSAVQDRKDLKMLVGILCASVGIWAAQAGIYCAVKGAAIDLGIEGSQMSERNDFTAALVGTLPILVYWGFSYRGRFPKSGRLLSWTVFGLSLVAIIFSMSRGASVGMAMTAMLYVMLVSGKKFRDLFVITAVIGIALSLMPDVWWERMNTIEISADQKEGSAKERMSLMLGAVRATMDRPIFGWGPDGWLQVVSVYGNGIHNPHSIYLKLSSETGLVGLLIYLGVIAFTYFRVMKVIKMAKKKGDRDFARLGMALIMSTLGLLSAMFFLNAPFNEYLWAWICLANAYPNVHGYEIAQREKSIKTKERKAAKALIRERRRAEAQAPLVKPVREGNAGSGKAGAAEGPAGSAPAEGGPAIA